MNSHSFHSHRKLHNAHIGLANKKKEWILIKIHLNAAERRICTVNDAKQQWICSL